MHRTRVKICGITRPEDGVAAARLGADAIGLVFFNKSPRAVDLEQGRAIIAALPPLVSVVALFVNPEPEWVEQVLAELSIDLLQFHGEESPHFCASFGRRYIKAIRMEVGVDLAAARQHYHSASALLLDAFSKQAHGGTGDSFEWDRIPLDMRSKIILAGGLDSRNLADAISQVSPWAVDLSSGAEGETKGIKDHQRMAEIMAIVGSLNG